MRRMSSSAISVTVERQDTHGGPDIYSLKLTTPQGDMMLYDTNDYDAAQADSVLLRNLLNCCINLSQWQPIETAPEDQRIIIAVVDDTGEHQPIVGEARFWSEDGEWYWGADYPGNYSGGPIRDINHGTPKFWQPLPKVPVPIHQYRMVGHETRTVFTRPDDNVTMMSHAAQDVLDERRRQIEVEGWTPEHDDEHAVGEMAVAASAYALNAALPAFPRRTPHKWLWDLRWWKPTTPRRDLIKAGALIIAEIERLDRAAAKEGGAS
ncbi:MAG: hypothetical protein AAGC58_02335 [Asticcacaulis sp.]